MHAEVQKLEVKVTHIIVGTSGHVSDMLNWKNLSFKYIKMFVLDEADEMLSHGFRDVFEKVHSNTQGGSLSAAVPSNVLEVTKKFMRDPIQILVEKEDLTLEDTVHPFCIRVRGVEAGHTLWLV